jgi:CP family cyanate transporter-like MFS transporter
MIGLYLLMLSGGAILGSLAAVPFFTAAGGSVTSPSAAGSAAVRGTLALWAAPALLAAILWVPQWRYRTVPAGLTGRPVVPAGAEARPVARAERAAPRPAGSGASGRRTAGAIAMGRHALAWQVMLFMGLQSLSYYATLSWFPTMFQDRGVSAAHAGDLLALMNLGNAVTALVIPVLAQRAADQRRLVVMAMLATGAGIAGAMLLPAGYAAGSVFLLGLGQGATLGLGIFYTMARASDPVSAASLSAFAQGIGYLIASLGPLSIGLVHDATGGWTVPAAVLLGVAVLQVITGWLAGRARTVPVTTP